MTSPAVPGHRLERLRLGTVERPWSIADCECGENWTYTLERAHAAGIRNADEMETRLREDHARHAAASAARQRARPAADFYA